MPDTAPRQSPIARATAFATVIEHKMAQALEKAPHLPQHVRQTLVDIAPWLALIGGVVGVLGALSTNAFTSALFTFGFLRSGILSLLFTIGMLLGLVTSVLELFAYQPLAARRKAGWNYLFYAALLAVVTLVLYALAGYVVTGNAVGLLLGFWLLFEVRDAYKV